MEWAFKKRAIYVGGLILVFVIIFAVPVYNLLNKEPSCFDGKKNGEETGIDCGGSCQNVCVAKEPIILWTRSFEVRDGVYNSIAMVENPNTDAGAKNISYVFRLYDNRNILIYERKGSVDITPQARFPIFESSIITGERIVQRTAFEFSDEISWFQESRVSGDLKVTEQNLTGEDTNPRLEIKVQNRGLKDINDVEYFVIIYDQDDNAIASSKTIVDFIKSDSTKEIIFTWPSPFKGSVGRVEIIPKFSLDR